jgi:CRP-like cAMP-binding protein
MASENFQNEDPVDRAGHSILRLLERAADAADQNSRQALEMAQTLSQQLRAARDRIAQLEGDVATYRDRAERVEIWLNKIRTEIEQQFPRERTNRRQN